MNIKARWMAWLKHQEGFSLVEILGAVTIMSVISVSMMGYFVTGLNKSADESRRIIAANLARLKAAEIREVLKSNTQFNLFTAGLVKGQLNAFNADDQLPTEFQDKQWLAADPINGTSYRFLIQWDLRDGTRRSELAGMIDAGSPSPDKYLVQMYITVYWDNTDGLSPRPSKSTTIDTYVVNSGV